MHQKMAATLDSVVDEIRAIQKKRAQERQGGAAALADDRAAHAEGLDRSEGGRRPQGRGLLALASGAVFGRTH